jgi:hypothetical protein
MAIITDEEIIEAVKKYGSGHEAAKHLAIHKSNIYRRLNKLAIRGFSPEHDMTKIVPEAYVVKGISTNYGEDGSIKSQWVKTKLDDQIQMKIVEAAVQAMAETIVPVPAQHAPKKTVTDLANLYVITDYHLGMLSWPEETGDDWNTAIAEQMLVDWFGAAIAQSPDAETGIFCQLGDFLHQDSIEAVTPASRHLLDADTRFQKIVNVAIRAIRRVIGMLLAKHKRVIVIMAEGNHDTSSSIWLRELFAALYADEPRVIVDTSPDPYYCVEHGNTALFFHHGHKHRKAGIDTVFAAKFREVFGRTKYAYAHMGHLHHVDLKETNLMLVEQHRTLAAKDAYASRGGWMSDRDAQVITYSKKFGEVGRVRVSAHMLEAV